MKMELKKEGNFVAQFDGDCERKCDLSRIMAYHYCVVISATDDKLTAEGFIIENSRVQSYFDDVYDQPQPARSCELMARDGSVGLAQLMQHEGISVLAVTTT